MYPKWTERFLFLSLIFIGLVLLMPTYLEIINYEPNKSVVILTYPFHRIVFVPKKYNLKEWLQYDYQFDPRSRNTSSNTYYSWRTPFCDLGLNGKSSLVVTTCDSVSIYYNIILSFNLVSLFFFLVSFVLFKKRRFFFSRKKSIHTNSQFTQQHLLLRKHINEFSAIVLEKIRKKKKRLYKPSPKMKH